MMALSVKGVKTLLGSFLNLLCIHRGDGASLGRYSTPTPRLNAHHMAAQINLLYFNTFYIAAFHRLFFPSIVFFHTRVTFLVEIVCHEHEPTLRTIHQFPRPLRHYPES